MTKFLLAYLAQLVLLPLLVACRAVEVNLPPAYEVS